MGIAFKVDSSFKRAIPRLILTFTNWNFGFLLQYLHSYLTLPTGILGHHCNTYTHTCLYQLEFWGFIVISKLVFTFTNWNLWPNYNIYTCTYLYELGFWGLVTIRTFNINIITIIVFLHFTLFVFGLWFPPTKLIVKQNS
jgi:hypothetical protein